MLSHVEELKIYLKSSLNKDPYRYFHSLLVLSISKDIALSYPYISLPHLSIASLMHDLAKPLSLETALQIANTHNEVIPELYQKHLSTLHGYTATLLLKYEQNINDPLILEAIEHHTTGKKDLSDLGIIVYIADYLASIHQSNPENFIAIYEMAIKNLHYTALQIVNTKIQFLEQRAIMIHPASYEFQNWLEQKTSSQ